MKPFWPLNLLLFQCAWFSAAFYPTQAPWIMVLLLALHFYFSPTPKADAKLTLLVPIGICVDKLMMHFEVFSGGQGIFPLFLLLLWCFFILSLNHSLLWVTRVSVPIQMLLGSIGGASSYWAGIQAGALETSLETPWLLAILMCVWALLLPWLIYCHQLLVTRAFSNHASH
ncbi:conserved hypothetical membrane protein [Shewanella denitrificans OS217]|uniref:Conserved hypothetical membrane protein n=1 Tax=Shewanella denitrificans (strain OS217 / ATCC BAA-1090 / DSM 15013) TaxID=318161 RepID=Q12IT3_SHEDO|nr:DUF2878 domain-containing protein [Shewanella denitrificans]ABE56643.1 conserved hypothetical membrane protein [Shewanella denitrificans OS217]